MTASRTESRAEWKMQPKETGDRLIGWGASGRGATAWRPWADGRGRVRKLARRIDDCVANGRDTVAPLPQGMNSKGNRRLED